MPLPRTAEIFFDLAERLSSEMIRALSIIDIICGRAFASDNGLST